MSILSLQVYSCSLSDSFGGKLVLSILYMHILYGGDPWIGQLAFMQAMWMQM